MKINNLFKVGLTTIVCLLCQGFIFTYILKVEPSALVPIAPFFILIAYVYAKNRRVWWYHKPMYWMAAVVVLTMIDMAPYIWATMS